MGDSSKHSEKYLIQLIKRIWRIEGIKGYYVGFTGNLVGIPMTNTLSFSFYYYFKVKLRELEYMKRNKSNQNKLIQVDFLASTLTGVLTQTITNPIWVAKTRLQTQKLHGIVDYKNIFDALLKIYSREGIYGGFKGLLPSMFGTVHLSIYLPLYDLFNRLHDSYFAKGI